LGLSALLHAAEKRKRLQAGVFAFGPFSFCIQFTKVGQGTMPRFSNYYSQCS
jgi:hypothetical protein